MTGCRVIACRYGPGLVLCSEHDRPDIARMPAPHQYLYEGHLVVINSRPWSEFDTAPGNTRGAASSEFGKSDMSVVGGGGQPEVEAGGGAGQLAFDLIASTPAPTPASPAAVAMVEAGARDIGGPTPAPVCAPSPASLEPPPLALPQIAEPRPCRDWCGRAVCDSKRTYTRNPAVPCLVCAGPVPACSRWPLVCSTVCEDLRLALVADEIDRFNVRDAARPWLERHGSLADLQELDERLSMLEYEDANRQQSLVAVKRWMGRALGVDVVEGRFGTVWLHADWWPERSM